MAEYSRIARGSFTTAASPVAQVVNLPFQPQRVKLLNAAAYSMPAQYAVTTAQWDIAFGQGNTLMEYLSASTAPWAVAADYTPMGISTFAAGVSLQYGVQMQVASITKASPAAVTTASAHGLSTGDVVIFQGLYQSSSTGMPQICGIPFTVTVTSPTAFTIPWNTAQSNYTALSGSPSGAYVTEVLNPYLYLPGVDFISSISGSGAGVTVTTTTNHNFVAGQEVAFRIPSAWGSTQLNSLPDNLIPGSPVYYYVTSVTANNVFTITAGPYNSFTTNPAVASVPGLSFPQVISVGDVNSGGWPYSGGALYPSPTFPTFSGGAPTINGPAIQGAFVNNTAQGFVVQPGVGAVQSSAKLLTPSSLYVWEAFLYDISM